MDTLDPFIGLDAVRITDNRWIVRPLDTKGTKGRVDGVPWSVDYVTAKDKQEALIKGNPWRV